MTTPLRLCLYVVHMKTQPQMIFLQTKVDAKTLRWVRKQAAAENRTVAGWLRAHLVQMAEADSNDNNAK